MSRHHKRSVANINKVEKRHRQSEKRRVYNQSLKNRARTFVRKVRNPLLAGDVETAEAGLVEAVKALDKAAQKGAIHPNNAARRKSRLMKRLAAARASAS